jgi:hypothetical protein
MAGRDASALHREISLQRDRAVHATDSNKTPMKSCMEAVARMSAL